MRHSPRTHRVNRSWLYVVVQNGGNNSAQYNNTEQRCSGIFTKGFTKAEMWNILMSISGLFDMDHQHTARAGTHKLCDAMSNGNERIVMEMQHMLCKRVVHAHRACRS